MFLHHISLRTRSFLSFLVTLGLTLTLLWLLNGAIAVVDALPIERGSRAPATPLAPNAILTVTNANDDGPGSLRQAIADAADGDVINFDNSYSIYLSSTLEISKQLTIDGGTYTVTVSGDSLNDGSPNVQVFSIDATGAVTLSHLNIVSGTAVVGGGIQVMGGELTLQNSTLAGNTAEIYGGAIESVFSTIVVQHSSLIANSARYGGGIYHDLGTMEIQESVLTGNSASSGSGGGIYAYTKSSIVVTNSVFSRNLASTYGGGIFNYSDETMIVRNSTFAENAAAGSGGGIYNYNVLLIRNSTLVSNTAANFGGGIFSNRQTAMWNNTLAGNSATSGGGVYANNAGLTLYSTIIANSPTGGDCISNGDFVYNIHNLIEDNTCNLEYSGDPHLGPLQDNGGSTWTMALLPGSPAIDVGDDATCSPVDQRGVSRPQGAHCDIGAYEAAFTTHRVYLPIVLK